MEFLPFLIRLCGISLFSSGFLLTRQNDSPPGLPPTHSKVMLVILQDEAYQFTLAHELSYKHPTKSWIFNASSELPITTTQRINALVTGSPPDLVDITVQLGGGEHDNWLVQARRANKTTAFVGPADDTWLTLYSHLFDTTSTFNFDHLDGIMDTHDILVVHAQHKRLLRRVVDAISYDTLFIVLGDHQGENNTEMWIYSPGVHLSQNPAPLYPSRPIQQVDIVPTLSLLLGLPIPFQNLGRPILELFPGSACTGRQGEALKQVAQQMETYLRQMKLHFKDVNTPSDRRITISIFIPFKLSVVNRGVGLMLLGLAMWFSSSLFKSCGRRVRHATLGAILSVLISLSQRSGTSGC